MALPTHSIINLALGDESIAAIQPNPEGEPHVPCLPYFNRKMCAWIGSCTSDSLRK